MTKYTMLKFWIFGFFVFADLVNADSRYCQMEAIRRSWGCGNLYGYHHSRGFNFTQMIRYCRDSDRADIGQCMIDAYADCPEVLPESLEHLFPRQMEMLSQGLDYICSKLETLEDNGVCLSQNAPSVNQCEKNTKREMMQEFSTVSSDNLRSLMARRSRYLEECIYGELKTGCNTEAANLIGNLVYAVSTYIYG